MSTVPNGHHDPEDMFHHTRMSLGDHIEELRRHMIKALLGFLVAMVVGLFVSTYVLNFINAPVEAELLKMYQARRIKVFKEYEIEAKTMPFEERYKEFPLLVPNNETSMSLGAKPLDPPDEKWLLLNAKMPVEQTIKLQPPPKLGDRPPTLTSLTAPEVFIVYMKVSVYCGIVLASPWIFYQMWMFIAAGLYTHEKIYVHVYLPFSILLFLCGVALCEFVILPIGIHYLLSWNESLGIQPELRLSEWLSFAIMMPLISGGAFQTPLVMFFLERAGIVKTEQYIKHWRIATFGLTLAGALLALSPDPLSMMSLAIPMCALYWVGILLCLYMPKHKDNDLDVPESEETFEG